MGSVLLGLYIPVSKGSSKVKSHSSDLFLFLRPATCIARRFGRGYLGQSDCIRALQVRFAALLRRRGLCGMKEWMAVRYT
jgi:hypothetical protein